MNERDEPRRVWPGVAPSDVILIQHDDGTTTLYGAEANPRRLQQGRAYPALAY